MSELRRDIEVTDLIPIKKTIELLVAPQKIQKKNFEACSQPEYEISKRGLSVTENVCSTTAKNVKSSSFKCQAQGLKVSGMKTVPKPSVISKNASVKRAPKNCQTDRSSKFQRRSYHAVGRMRQEYIVKEQENLVKEQNRLCKESADRVRASLHREQRSLKSQVIGELPELHWKLSNPCLRLGLPIIFRNMDLVKDRHRKLLYSIILTKRKLLVS
mmetsp:Transcript_26969/g.33096  ORF Transcript_26969/g.33096 Transcript_26969/m.33096 type:complete len:215 (+) Transcript_26969:505-1149(+)